MKLLKISKLIFHKWTENKHFKICTHRNKIKRRIVNKSYQNAYSESFELASCMWEVKSFKSSCEEVPNFLELLKVRNISWQKFIWNSYTFIQKIDHVAQQFPNKERPCSSWAWIPECSRKAQFTAEMQKKHVKSQWLILMKMTALTNKRISLYYTPLPPYSSGKSHKNV